jgi:hypothetical protein
MLPHPVTKNPPRKFLQCQFTSLATLCLIPYTCFFASVPLRRRSFFLLLCIFVFSGKFSSSRPPDLSQLSPLASYVGLVYHPVFFQLLTIPCSSSFQYASQFFKRKPSCLISRLRSFLKCSQPRNISHLSHSI